MGDYGFGGDLNGNGKFDPGDYEIWKDTMKDPPGGGGGGNSGGSSGAGLLIFILICLVVGAVNELLGALMLFFGLYIRWLMH